MNKGGEEGQHLNHPQYIDYINHQNQKYYCNMVFKKKGVGGTEVYNEAAAAVCTR
jgi:hypothetical protein